MCRLVPPVASEHVTSAGPPVGPGEDDIGSVLGWRARHVILVFRLLFGNLLNQIRSQDKIT
ncbi:hypothetical protein AB395_00001735 [Sinorhizobium fredii CCBAU 45436]|nr:hypothetical protein SF83666_c16930 [Sinorhizobium fredii CCBAU 83666]AWI57389.1 hypothetical protein AB395_00001735 [Sinorhizobium fredii CCBAU 45436]AWM25246.1 hypothetical protein AOX55_00001994 [Sinorhizobium fredii CCBAU 25509]